MDFNAQASLLLCVALVVNLFQLPKQKIQEVSSSGPPRWPIFGNLLQLGQLPHRDLASLRDKYGPLVCLRLGTVDAITTNDPDIIREILRRDEVFASRPRTIAKHRAEEAQHLVRDVQAQAQNGKPVNVREVLGAFSMNNVTRMLGKQYFGAESAGPQEAREFVHVTHDIFRLLGLIYLGDYLPFWRWVDPYGCERKMRHVEKRVDDFHSKIIEEHKEASKMKGNEVAEGEMDFVDIIALIQNAYWILPFMFLRRSSVALLNSRRFISAKSTHDISSAISELNKEMESVFGEPPPAGLSGSSQEPQFNSHELVSSLSNTFLDQESKSVSQRVIQNAPGLTHIDSGGEAQMVDVSPKENSKRTAIASCKVMLGKKVFDMVSANQMGKGDVLTVAKIAGINGAKHTSSLIPLCHNITLTHVRVDLMLNPDNYSVEIEGEASTTEKTGVEMEAMTAVTTAGLTVYDMCKAASKEIQITDVRLEHKTGGKSGDWNRNVTKPMDMSK